MIIIAFIFYYYTSLLKIKLHLRCGIQCETTVESVEWCRRGCGSERGIGHRGGRGGEGGVEGSGLWLRQADAKRMGGFSADSFTIITTAVWKRYHVIKSVSRSLNTVIHSRVINDILLFLLSYIKAKKFSLNIGKIQIYLQFIFIYLFRKLYTGDPVIGPFRPPID